MSLITKLGPQAEPISLTEAKSHLRVDFSTDDALITAYITAARLTVENFTSRRLVIQTLEQRLDMFPGITHPIELLTSPLWDVDSIQYVDTASITQTLDPTIYRVDRYSDEPRIMPVFAKVWPFTLPTSDAVTVSYKAGYLMPVSIDTVGDTMTFAGHPLSAGDAVRVHNTDNAPPGGLALNTNYYVVNPTTNTIQLAATVGGAAINLTSTGTGLTFLYQRDFYPLINALKLILGHFYENREDVLVEERRATIQQLPMGAQSLMLPYCMSIF